MKKILTLVIILLSSLSLISCGEGENTTLDTQNQQKSGTEVMIEENDAVSHFSELPDWAIKIGIELPEGLTLNEKTSTVDSRDEEQHVPESISLDYSGDKEKILSESKRLAEKLGLNIQDYNDSILANGHIEDGEKDYSINISSRTDIETATLYISAVRYKSFE